MRRIPVLATLAIPLAAFVLTASLWPRACAAGEERPAASPAAGAAPAAPTPPGRGPRTIEVTGQGEAHTTPDLAFLNLAIETRAATAQESASKNAALAQKVVGALKAKLGDKGRVWTGGYSLYPEYSEPRGREKPTIVGYRTQNSITVRTQAIDLLGALIDAAIAAGANQINYLNFSVTDETQARGQAIAKAAHDAQARAQALADALGVKLGPVLKASTVTEVRPIPVEARTFMAAAQAPTPVEPTEITVPATVSLTYEIE